MGETPHAGNRPSWEPQKGHFKGKSVKLCILQRPRWPHSSSTAGVGWNRSGHGIFQHEIQLNILSSPLASQGFSIYWIIYPEWEPIQSTGRTSKIHRFYLLHVSFYLKAPVLHSKAHVRGQHSPTGHNLKIKAYNFNLSYLPRIWQLTKNKGIKNKSGYVPENTWVLSQQRYLCAHIYSHSAKPPLSNPWGIPQQDALKKYKFSNLFLL